MIELCPSDNLGIRFELQEIYEKLNDEKSLKKLQQRFDEYKPEKQV